LPVRVEVRLESFRVIELPPSITAASEPLEDSVPLVTVIAPVE